MKRGKLILVPVNSETIIEGQSIVIQDSLLGTRIGKIKSIHKELGKIIFEENGHNFTATKGVVISEAKIIIVEHEASNSKYQTPLKYSDWKNVIDNKLIDTDVYFKFETLYPDWNNYEAIDIAFIVNHKDDDVYIGRLGDAIDFVQEYPEAINDLIKASLSKVK